MRVVPKTRGRLRVVVSAEWYERERPYRAAGTAGELQRRHYEQRTSRRQRSKVRELRNAILSRTEEVVVERERRIKASGRTSVDADGLHTDADDRALFGEPAGALGVEAGVGPIIEEEFLVVSASVPAPAEEQPATLGQWPVLGLAGAHIPDGPQVVGISFRIGGFVDHDRGGHEDVGWDLRYVPAFAAGDPVYGCVEVSADVLA